MEKKNLGVIQIILGSLLLIGLVSFSSYLLPLFFDDAKIPFSFGAIILILIGVQNISQSKFWQNNITKSIIIVPILIGLYISTRSLPILIFFIAMLLQQVYTITPFIKSKTLGWIELIAFMLICLISIFFIVDLIWASWLPAGFSDDKSLAFLAQGGYIIILSVIIFSIALLINSIFNFGNTRKEKN